MCLRCLFHHILSLIAYTFRENRDFVFIIIVQFMMSANIRIRFGLQIVFVCLYITLSHYHHCANLSEDIELIKCLSSVWVRLSILSQLYIYIIYMGLCVFSLPIFLVMIERIYTLFYYHHQIGRMNYYPLFRVRSWNSGMRCMSLYSYGAREYDHSCRQKGKILQKRIELISVYLLLNLNEIWLIFCYLLGNVSTYNAACFEGA